MITALSLNPIAILVAAIVSMVIGFVYYSPLVMGKPWMAEMGMTPKKTGQMKKKMGVTYGLSFLAAIVTAIVLTGFSRMVGAANWTDALLISFLAWLGFAATTGFIDALFSGKSAKLFAINSVHQLLSFCAIGIIVTLIR